MEIEKLLETIKVDKDCWRKKGCLFNSNTQGYMKCKQGDYSVNQCLKDNIERVLRDYK